MQTLYNTLTRKKETLKPIEPGKVRMYACGPTVYDYLHIGNFRGAIFFNLVRNWFEASGYKVSYVYNYTDIDDKIIKRAAEQGISPAELTQKFIAEFEKDYAALHLGKLLDNPNMDDRTNKMEGPVSSFMHKIENIFSEGK